MYTSRSSDNKQQATDEAVYERSNSNSAANHALQIASIPGYEIIKELGHGTQGKIFLGKRTSDNQEVAIKQLNIESVTNWKAYDLFNREATVLKSLNIEGVAKFYDAFEQLEAHPPCSYIVQEYIHGKTLNDMLKAGHRFSLNRVFDIILQLLNILKELHRHDPPVIHRDIKPSNILLQPIGGDNYKVYLIDFGAVANPQVQSGGSTVAGTYGYMPPEQLMGKPEPASDIYSLGAVAVHILSGKSPADMPVKDFRLIFEPDMQNMIPSVVSVLRKMLEPKVENRWSDIDKLIQVFNEFNKENFILGKENKKTDLSEKEFDDRLSKVSFCGENGNFELWQNLSDVTPRTIPSCYNSHSHNTSLFEITPKLYSQNKKLFDKPIDENDFNLVEERLERAREFKRLMISLIAWIFFILVIVFSVFIFTLDFTKGVITLIVSLIFAGILLIDSSYYFKSWRNNKSSSKPNKQSKKIQSNDLLPNDEKILPIIDNLITYGRKTIATIVSIEYQLIPQKYVYTKFDIERDYYTVQSAPIFIIKYKFNPPDDSKEEDLIHQVITHIEPENHYAVGDPLPILYKISTKRVSAHFEIETVHSMPFPFPINDIMDYSDVLGKSEVKKNSFSQEDIHEDTSKDKSPSAMADDLLSNMIMFNDDLNVHGYSGNFNPVIK